MNCSNSTIAPSSSPTLPANAPTQNYLRVPLQRPAGGSTPDGSYSYNPGDSTVADLDGVAADAEAAQRAARFHRLQQRRQVAAMDQIVQHREQQAVRTVSPDASAWSR